MSSPAPGREQETPVHIPALQALLAHSDTRTPLKDLRDLIGRFVRNEPLVEEPPAASGFAVQVIHSLKGFLSKRPVEATEPVRKTVPGRKLTGTVFEALDKTVRPLNKGERVLQSVMEGSSVSNEDFATLAKLSIALCIARDSLPERPTGEYAKEIRYVRNYIDLVQGGLTSAFPSLRTRIISVQDDEPETEADRPASHFSDKMTGRMKNRVITPLVP